MPAMNFKTVILYNVRRIRPETLTAISEAQDGDMVPVDQSEIDQFLPIVIHQPEIERVSSPSKPVVKASGGQNAR